MALMFDLLLLIGLLTIAFLDAKKGFLRASVGFARILIAVAVAMAFSGVFAALIDRTWIFPSVHRTVCDAFASGGAESGHLISALPIAFKAIAALGDVDLQKIADSSSSEALSHAIAEPISRCISAAIAFAVLLIGAYLALKIVVPLLSKALRTFSLFKTADTVLGLVFGIFHAFLIGWGVSFAAVFLLSMFGISLDETYLIRFFHHVSPIKAIVWIFLR